MVVQFFKALRREYSGLHEAAFLLGIFALLSQIMAIVRDRLFAGQFGAGIELDIYYAAFRIPDIVFVSIASFVAITVIMPFFIERKEESAKKASMFIHSVFTVFFLVIVAVSAVLYIFIPTIVRAFMGFEGADEETLIHLSRILLLSPLLLGISNIFASITQAYRNFLVYAISPLLYNLGIIFGLIFFYPEFGLQGLMYGVIFGAVLHAGIQLPVVVYHGFLPRFTLNIVWKDVQRVLVLALPRTLGLSAQQITLFILTAIASSMVIGSVAVFQLAFNLQSVPLSIIGVSYSVAAFPTLAHLYSKKQSKEFVKQVLTAVRHIIFWSLPVMALFIVLRAQIVRTILGAGEFNWDDTRLTAAALAVFSVSVVAQSLILLFVRGYYAAGKTFIPVAVNISSAIFIAVSAIFLQHVFVTSHEVRYFFESLLRIEGIPGSVMLALPLAYSLGMLINVFVLWHFFKRDFHVEPSRRLQRTFRHSLYAAVMMGVIAYHLLDVFDDMFDLNTLVGIFSQGFLAGVGGILFGVLLLKAVKNQEIDEIHKALGHRFWRSKPVLPDKENIY